MTNGQTANAEALNKFNIGSFTASRQKNRSEQEKNTKDSPKKVSLILRCENFLGLCDTVFEQIQKEYEKIDHKDAVERLQLQHKAVIGDSKSVKIVKDEIQEFIRTNNFTNTEYPECYTDLADAVFHETLGFGPLRRWWEKPDSQSALVLGTQIFHDGVLQEERFSKVERVQELIRSLCMKDSKSHVSEYDPDLEIDMEDGTRVSISVPPRSPEYQITLRKFVVQDFSLNNLVKLGTIPEEALPIFHALVHGMPNTLICGPVMSGKSHTLKVFVNERYKERKLVCVSMEKHPELALRKMLPFAPILEKSAAEGELHEIFVTVLRNDLDFGIMGEIRGVEAECSMLLCERGTFGFLGSTHIKRPVNVPGTFARLILDRFSNRNYGAELMRVAENIDFVIIQKPLKDRKKKRITSIQELRFNPDTLEVSSHEIMRYIPESDSWEYKFDLSPEVINEMRLQAPGHTENLIKTLQRLEQTKPIKSENVVVSKSMLG